MFSFVESISEKSITIRTEKFMYVLMNNNTVLALCRVNIFIN